MIIRYKYSPNVTATVTNNDLRFLVPAESRLLNLWRSFVVVFFQFKQPIPKYPARMFRILDLRFLQAPSRSLLGSCLINAGFVFFLLWMIQNPMATPSNSTALPSNAYEIYYIPPPASHVKKTMPRIAPAGPGGVPGLGDLEAKLARLGSTAFHAKIIVVSQPLHPNNTHQTIIQPITAPDIRKAEDLHLPNLMLSDLMSQPRAVVRVPWRSPTLKAPTPNPTKTAATDMAPPTVARTSPDAVLVILGSNTPAPALPVLQPPATAATPSNQKSGPAVDNASVSGMGTSEGGTLVVMSTDGSGASGLLNLPGGNGAGAFSISPYGTMTGSPGGVAGGTVGGGGHDGKGSGGDGSVGVGTGKSGGGGGGTTSDSGTFSVNGTDAGPRNGTLGAAPVAEDMVIELTPRPSFRKNVLIVSAGPMGGGGLGVYQALPCRKIYTVFLPMPDTNWTLQYCRRDDPNAEQAASAAGSATTVHLQDGLIPPAPTLQFDFKRLPVPPEKARKMIVLKGTIREDGTVENVQIYAGVLPLMDEAARLAFSRWKFTPALRLGKPVTVQILVGIAMTQSKP